MSLVSLHCVPSPHGMLAARHNTPKNSRIRALTVATLDRLPIPFEWSKGKSRAPVLDCFCSELVIFAVILFDSDIMDFPVSVAEGQIYKSEAWYFFIFLNNKSQGNCRYWYCIVHQIWFGFLRCAIGMSWDLPHWCEINKIGVPLRWYKIYSLMWENTHIYRFFFDFLLIFFFWNL